MWFARGGAYVSRQGLGRGGPHETFVAHFTLLGQELVMIDRRKSLITLEKNAENRNGLEDKLAGGRAGFDEDHIGPGHYTYLTRPFWSWFVPDASNKSANGVTRIFGQDLSFLDEWVESLARKNHTSKYGADIIVNFWQHLEGGRASGLRRRRRHLWKSRCCSASDEHSSIYHW